MTSLNASAAAARGAAAPAPPLDVLYAAYVVGLEVMARLGRTLGSAHYAAGWHPTGTAGAVTGAAAGAHLLRLDAQQTATALSISASRSGGVRAQFGTPGKPLHVGLAAQASVEAVKWARTGLHTADDAVTGPSGLLAAFGVAEEERAALTDERFPVDAIRFGARVLLRLAGDC